MLWICPAETDVGIFALYQNGEYVFYLPADVDESEQRLYYSAASCEIDGTAVPYGGSAEVLAGITQARLLLGDEEAVLRVYRSASLPAVFIDTESGSMDRIHADKEYKEAAVCTVLEHGRATLTAAPLDYIKGRGNSTWKVESKKPYNIKFSKKTDIFGMGAAKKWCLLANASDLTMLGNAAALTFAARMALPYAVEYEYIDLYLNGIYAGTYMICEKVEVGGERVDIEDLDKGNEAANPGTDANKLQSTVTGGTDASGLQPGARKYIPWNAVPEDISGGYLLECTYADDVKNEPSGFLTDRGAAVLVKSPELAAKQELDYIAELYQAAEDALASKSGVNAQGRTYQSYFDMPSVTDLYLLHEYLVERDECMYSCFLFKRAGDDLLYAGPAWDFDAALRDPNETSLLIARLYTQQEETLSAGQTPFRLMCLHDDFWDYAAERWALYADWAKNEFSAEIAALRDRIAASAAMNIARWRGTDVLLPLGDTPAEQTENWYAATEALLLGLPQRAELLRTGLSNRDAALQNTRHNALPFNLKPAFFAVFAAAAVACVGCAAFYVLRKKRKGPPEKKAPRKKKSDGKR